MQLPNFFPQKQQNEGGGGGGCTVWWSSPPLTQLASPWNKLELLSPRARGLRNFTLPYRSLSAKSSHSGRRRAEMRGRRGNKNRQRVEGGWSHVRVWSKGGRKLWHFSRMKVNGTEDLQDYANEKRSAGRSMEEQARKRVASLKMTQNRGGRWKTWMI